MEGDKNIDNSQMVELKVRFPEDELSKIKSLLKDQVIEIEENLQYKEYQSNYFQSQECEYIYYLAVLTGEAQTKALAISPAFYKDKKKAKAWRDKIIKKIHPDKSKHPDAKEATEALNNLYERMSKNAK